MKTNTQNLSQFMANPRAYALKKWFASILGERCMNHNNIIERIAPAIVTESDMLEFGKLLGEVYEVGYMKAAEQYREQCELKGMKVHVTKTNQ